MNAPLNFSSNYFLTQNEKIVGLSFWNRYFVAMVALLLNFPFMLSAGELSPIPDARLQLRWEVERNVYTALFPDGRSQASLTLTNLDSKPLPASGWSIYFNCIAGVELGSTESHIAFEQVTGTLFRLRPTAEFKELGIGQTVKFSYFHPEIMIKSDKGPKGPYLVFDDAPKVGHAIVDYQIQALFRPEQLGAAPHNHNSVVTAEELFQRNEVIVDIAENVLPPVFPTPLHFERRSGTLHWSTLPDVKADKKLAYEVALAKKLLAPYFVLRSVSSAIIAQPALHLIVASIAGQTSPEAYELNVDPITGVTLTGNSTAGVARGLQSLRSLLPIQAQPQNGLLLPALSIIDAPRFEYRGLLLDVARNFQSKESVFRLLDLMARYKLNKFHFHLTDDEGWRLEIASIPELTSIGARRGHTLDSMQFLPPAYGSGPDVRDTHGSGFYSANDYIEILKYADARHIEVIPEIEMPGHARAAVKAMESRFRTYAKMGRRDAAKYLISDLDDESTYKSAQLYTDHVMNPGMPSTYVFIERVVAEVAALYQRAGVKLHTIHVGGDELPNGAWEKSPASLAMMKRLKLASTTELWNYFYKRVDQILYKNGLFASGWEELGARKVKLYGDDKLIPNPLFAQRGFNLFVWNNLDGVEDLAYRLANAGYSTVLAPATNLYFDMAHNKNPEEPGVNWAAYTDLDTVFDFIPFDYIRKSLTDSTHMPGKDGLTDYGQRNILGLEGTLFSETMREPARIDYLLMPRMLALAERAWAANPAWAQETVATKIEQLHASAWSIFVNQLGKQVLPRLDAEQLDVQYRIPPPGLKIIDHKVFVNHQLPGFSLRYSIDESEPTCKGFVASSRTPILIRSIIQVVACDRNDRPGRSSRVDNR